MQNSLCTMKHVANAHDGGLSANMAGTPGTLVVCMQIMLPLLDSDALLAGYQVLRINGSTRI